MYKRQANNALLSAPGFKQFFDGVSSEHTAYLTEPYTNPRFPGDQGRLTVPAERMRKLVLAAAERGHTVRIHVIGDGEKCPQLLQALKDAGAEVDWRGVVYDEAEKHAVMSCCHFGFNLMKPDVCVGLTMKSVDYFRHDLPILNNIPADTAELVDREQVGVNVGPDTAAQVAGMTVEDCLRMRENVRRVFDETFDLPVVQARYAALLRGIV